MEPSFFFFFRPPPRFPLLFLLSLSLYTLSLFSTPTAQRKKTIPSIRAFSLSTHCVQKLKKHTRTCPPRLPPTRETLPTRSRSAPFGVINVYSYAIFVSVSLFLSPLQSKSSSERSTTLTKTSTSVSSPFSFTFSLVASLALHQ